MPPRFGREAEVKITELVDLKGLADRWKRKMGTLRGRHADKIHHAQCDEKPILTLIEATRLCDAVLLPIVGSKYSGQDLKYAYY